MAGCGHAAAFCWRWLNPLALAGCVPSIRQWKLASLPTYLSTAQVQKVLDGCDRTTVMGRRDYAILMMLAKLGLRADEVATLTLDDVDWRSGEFAPRAGGERGCRSHQTSARPSSPTCAMVAPSRRVAGCSSAVLLRASALPPDAQSQ